MIVTNARNRSGRKNVEKLFCVLRRPIDGLLYDRTNRRRRVNRSLPLRSRNRANRRNYNGQSADLAATEATAVSPGLRRPVE